MIKYDLKLSPYLTASIEYEYEDYLTDKKYDVTLHYNQGKLTGILIYDEENGIRYPKTSRWNNDFWRKAPLQVNHDTGRYTRKCLYTTLNSASIPHGTEHFIRLEKNNISTKLLV